jgi:hypothetical protein
MSWVVVQCCFGACAAAECPDFVPTACTAAVLRIEGFAAPEDGYWPGACQDCGQTLQLHMVADWTLFAMYCMLVPFLLLSAAELAAAVLPGPCGWQLCWRLWLHHVVELNSI